MKIEEIRAVIDAASPAPWTASCDREGDGWLGPAFYADDKYEGEILDANLRFIVAIMRALAEPLLAVVEAASRMPPGPTGYEDLAAALAALEAAR